MKLAKSVRQQVSGFVMVLELIQNPNKFISKFGESPIEFKNSTNPLNSVRGTVRQDLTSLLVVHHI